MHQLTADVQVALAPFLPRSTRITLPVAAPCNCLIIAPFHCMHRIEQYLPTRKIAHRTSVAVHYIASSLDTSGDSVAPVEARINLLGLNHLPSKPKYGISMGSSAFGGQPLFKSNEPAPNLARQLMCHCHVPFWGGVGMRLLAEIRDESCFLMQVLAREAWMTCRCFLQHRPPFRQDLSHLVTW